MTYISKDDHKCIRTVDTTICDDDPHSGQKYILIINKEVQISVLANRLSCSKQCHLSYVQSSVVPNFPVDSPSDTTHAIQLVNPLEDAHLLINNVTVTGSYQLF